jgi:hypothetical protein
MPRNYHHTPGPWSVEPETATGHLFVFTARGGILVQTDRRNREHDARLIAAAPDLLAALEALLAHRECPTASPEAAAARAAIAEARGLETP